MKINIYYDRSFKTWVAFIVDENGFQISHAEYAYTKSEIKALKISDFRMN